MKRLFDVSASAIALLLLFLPSLIIAIAICLTSKGPAIYWSNRVGRDNKNFRMPKFRTMKIETPTLASHLLVDPDQYLTPIGRFLRRTSLDEIPQLWSILIGEMSLVGPRPALFNQSDLVAQRAEYGIDKLLPGLTGWAQINGRDELAIKDKVRLDYEYLQKCSLVFDLKILFLTTCRVVFGHGVSH